MNIVVASLHVYPIKSLGGFSVNSARITDRGFEHDRRWMLVDANGRFITQREVPTMACLHCTPITNGLRVTDVRDGDHIDVPLGLHVGARSRARVFDDEVDVQHSPTNVSAWFAEKLNVTCSLVFMPDRAQRPVDTRYATGLTSLSDGFPYVVLSQASLDDLNARGVSWSHTRMTPVRGPGQAWAHVPMDRFRPNIVIKGGSAFQEDGWKEIRIGSARFALVKPCGRCVIPTTDQLTGERSKEPTRTLATYRRRPGTEGEVKVDFGMNAMAVSGDVVHVGDLVTA
ncbi:MAG: MOSC domain-containing protein [Flavobacteriales bacterium]|nr:MOSC domain-containing protein [Flavobacteriales bacterium]